ICIRGLYDPKKKFETERLEVHHIVPLKSDYNLRLEDENLITLCEKHHEMAEAGLIPANLLKRIAKEQTER
ncbi:MAG: HNH endonuclease, partial [Anaerotignum sp.]|nr:HNH endonuclease [Anaerotignum sp.]